MGCGPSTEQPISSSDITRYQGHGTDYTHYDRLEVYYQQQRLQKEQEDNNHDQQNSNHHLQEDDHINFWQEYQQQQQKYLKQQRRLEKKRNHKLQLRLQEKIQKRKEIQQQQQNMPQETEPQQPGSHETEPQEDTQQQQLSAEDDQSNEIGKLDMDDEVIPELEQLLIGLQQRQDDEETTETSNDQNNEEYNMWSKSQIQRESPEVLEERISDHEEEVHEQQVDEQMPDAIEDETQPAETEAAESKPPTESLSGIVSKMAVIQSVAEKWKGWSVTKQTQPSDEGAGDLVVDVIDTVNDKSCSFISKKPEASEDRPFTDPEFTMDVALGKYKNELNWSRPQDIFPTKEICLFHEGTSMDDVKQGGFGDCYFLAVLAGLASQPHIMKQIIPEDAYNPKLGLFHCRFWRYGHWVDIYIDDYLPCRKDWNVLYGCRSNTHPEEMWIPLMEKAWAKFNGSYESMEAGQPSYAYLSLTGGTPELLYYSHSFYKGQFDSLSVYERVSNALQSGSLVVGSAAGVGEAGTTQNLVKNGQELGLVMNHAYTLTGAALIEKKSGARESLIRLRNPWAEKEWTGKWSDKSPQWNTIPAKAKSNFLDKKENGEFWMPWDDFYKFFSSVNICHYTPDYDSDGITDGLVKVCCIYGQWKGKLTGGFKNRHSNPTYKFTVPKLPSSMSLKAKWIVIEMIVKKEKGNKPANKDEESFDVNLEDIGGKDDKTVHTYTISNHITRRFEIHSERSYSIIPSTFNSGMERQFLLRVFSQHKLDITPVQY